MEVTPQTIYQQAIDKQRVVIMGSNKSVIGAMVSHVLKYHHRKFDYVADKQLNDGYKVSEAPVIIIESEDENVLRYHHHIGVLSSENSTEQAVIESFCNATPKSGILIYPESNSALKSIGSKERTDVMAIGYKPYPHEQNGAGIQLISSTKEKVPVKISGSKNLEALSAAKEILKKIGITSGQFYKAISSFALN